MKTKLSKEKWTLSFDVQLKQLVRSEAKKRRVYPVHLLEELVKEKFNPFGHVVEGLNPEEDPLLKLIGTVNAEPFADKIDQELYGK